MKTNDLKFKFSEWPEAQRKLDLSRAAVQFDGTKQTVKVKFLK